MSLFEEYVPFGNAYIFCEMSPGTLKTYIVMGKVKKVPNPYAPGRFLYCVEDLKILKDRKRRKR